MESVCSYTPVYFLKLSIKDSKTFEEIYKTNLIGDDLKDQIQTAINEKKNKNNNNSKI